MVGWLSLGPVISSRGWTGSRRNSFAQSLRIGRLLSPNDLSQAWDTLEPYPEPIGAPKRGRRLIARRPHERFVPQRRGNLMIASATGRAHRLARIGAMPDDRKRREGRSYVKCGSLFAGF